MTRPSGPRPDRSAGGSVKADWVETPHNFSNKAVTPYIQGTPGLFTVPATVPITFKKLATVAGDTAGVLASDDLIAAYQSDVPRGHAAVHADQRRTLRRAVVRRSTASAMDVAYDRRDKYGSKSTYGPIGDRPPRTLNIQLAEPVDYNTNELTLAAEHQGGQYQVRAE